MSLPKPPSVRLRRARAAMRRAERLRRSGRKHLATRTALAAVRILGNPADGKIRVVSPKTARHETEMLRLIGLAKTFGVHLCAYTGTFNPERDVHGRACISAEHVVPQCIGGAVTSGVFVLQGVDQNANSTLGRHVDRPFIRSALIQGARYACSMRYADPGNPSSLFLIYYGQSKLLSTDERVCDVWQEPANGLVFHFHAPYPRDPETPVHAGHPIGKRPAWDPGEVYWASLTDNPVWVGPILTAIQTEFPGATIILVNIRFDDGHDRILTPEQQAMCDRIMPMVNPETPIECRFAMSLFFAERWLAKIALGFGALLLGDRFSISPDARRLRDFMWTKASDDRQTIGLNGTGFITGADLPFIRVPDCHTFAIMDVGSLVLHITLYGRLQATVSIATDRNLWSECIHEHTAFIVAPTIKESVGPIAFADLLGHMATPNNKHLGLSALQAKISAVPEPPPRRLARSPPANSARTPSSATGSLGVTTATGRHTPLGSPPGRTGH